LKTAPAIPETPLIESELFRLAQWGALPALRPWDGKISPRMGRHALFLDESAICRCRPQAKLLQLPLQAAPRFYPARHPRRQLRART